MVAAAIFDLEKLIPLSQFSINFHQLFINFSWNVATLNRNSSMASKNFWLPESNMAAAAILNLEKLTQFFHILIKFHQIW